ncbi:MAG: hypothetical protein IJ418_09140 [Clostridia bacterium]|nr:hypothetical protein [Clostridia bacterium]
MANPWKARVLAFNRRRAEADEKAQDLLTLLTALPPGQVKQLLKDEACAAILGKYGLTEEDA